MKTPDEQVGENIIAEFKKHKLLSEAALDKPVGRPSGRLRVIDGGRV